jgi:N-methylhydantoinase B
MKRIDPVTIEIIQNRLMEIGWQGGYTLTRTAASTGVVHASDLGFNISDHLGRSLVYSMWMPRHGTTLSYMLRSCMQRYKNRGINPGDMFLVNNPHDGALHNLDLAVIAPVHHHEKLIAWTACATHHLDIGAMTPGRAPLATDWRQEGLIISPIKIVVGGELQEDLFRFFLDNVRAPRIQGLDLKGQISANNVAKEKILELAGRYGVDTLMACYDEIIDFSETKTRERIQRLPPGKYEDYEQIDFDKIYNLKCTLTVEGDTLTFDFSGSDPQANSFINAALPCTVANVHNVFICLITPDIPVNEGCFRPIKVIAPEGTIFNCKPPAPTSAASTISGWKAMSLALSTLSMALAKSPEWWKANAGWGSSTTDVLITGVNRNGKDFFARVGGGAVGGGARANKDGLDFAGISGSTTRSLANIEDQEDRYPVLWLFRSMAVDSGGAGKYRGGVSTNYMAFKLHGADKAETLIWYTGRKVPAKGFVGGEPGSKSLVAIKRNTNVEQLLKHTSPRFEDIEGKETVLPGRNSPFILKDNDVIFMQCVGGGGYGNPYERDPALVRKDVIEGYVSPAKAKERYKVVINEGSLSLDTAATNQLRSSAKKNDGKN